MQGGLVIRKNKEGYSIAFVGFGNSDHNLIHSSFKAKLDTK